MKRLICILCLSIVIFSCQKGDNPNPINDSTSSVNEFLRNPNGVRINEFIEEGINKTAFFSTFLFHFRDNGTVVASREGANINGTYLVFRDDNRTELRMTFPLNGILYELTDDWYFVFQTANIIRFEDLGDIIQFQKQ